MLQKYIKHKLTEVKRKIRQIHNYIWRFRHSSLSTDKIIHREPADTEDLKSSINQVDLIDIHRTLRPTRIDIRLKYT